jgi:hypothetical protein
MERNKMTEPTHVVVTSFTKFHDCSYCSDNLYKCDNCGHIFRVDEDILHCDWDDEMESKIYKKDHWCMSCGKENIKQVREDLK